LHLRKICISAKYHTLWIFSSRISNGSLRTQPCARSQVCAKLDGRGNYSNSTRHCPSVLSSLNGYLFQSKENNNKGHSKKQECRHEVRVDRGLLYPSPPWSKDKIPRGLTKEMALKLSKSSQFETPLYSCSYCLRTSP
jgi:hypothetical protein